MLADGDGEKLSAVKNYTAVEILSDPRDIYAYGSGGHHVTDSPRKTTSWKKTCLCDIYGCLTHGVRNAHYC